MSEAAVEAPEESYLEAPDESALAASYEAPEATEEPAAEEAAEPAAEATEEPSTPTTGMSPQEISDYIARETDALVTARLSQHQPEAEQEEFEETPELDLFAEDAGAQLGNFIKQQIGEAMAPLLGPMQAAEQEKQAREAEELVKDAFAAVDVGGDFDRDAAADLFPKFRDEAVARYGVSNRALEYAVDKAARTQAARDKAIGDKAVERHMNQLKAVGGAAREPGVAGGGAVARENRFDDGDEMSIAARWQN